MASGIFSRLIDTLNYCDAENLVEIIPKYVLNKELMENAIDAGSSQVQLIIKEAGKLLIQVVDDGKGMKVDDSVENVTIVLARDPINEGAQIVTKVHGSGGLNTRQNAWHAQNLVAALGTHVVNCRPRSFRQVRWVGGN